MNYYMLWVSETSFCFLPRSCTVPWFATAGSAPVPSPAVSHPHHAKTLLQLNVSPSVFVRGNDQLKASIESYTSYLKDKAERGKKSPRWFQIKCAALFPKTPWCFP